MNADTTIGRRLREFRVISADIHSFTRISSRDLEIDQLRAAFAETPAQPAVRVLTGLGGVGKSSIARSYAAGHHHRYTLVWWINAQHADTIPEQFRALLGILAPDEATTMPNPVAAVHSVLANRTGRWLLVLDNVPDPTVARGLVPAAGPGDVVITSRARNWPAHNTIAVGCLDTDQGAALLTMLSGDPDRAAAEALSKELGGLPLALAQAGNYVATHPGTTLTEYQRLYDRYRLELHQGEQLPDYEQTVATTWQVAFDSLDPSARALLNLLCWWAPETIPLHLLLNSAPSEPLPEPVAALVEPLLTDELTRIRAISALDAVSLINQASPAGSVTIHRLVQAVTREHPGVVSEPWSVAAAQLAVHALPEEIPSVATLTRWNLLHTHLRTVLRHLHSDNRHALKLRSRLATWTGHSGDAIGARDQLTALLPNIERVLGPDDRETLIARSEHAQWTGLTEDVAEARDQYAALVLDMTQTLGPNDRETLIARGNLAYWTWQAGNTDDVRDQYAALVPDMTQALGPNDRNTLVTRCNLASLTGQAGDATTARDQFASLMVDTIRALGPDHPSTLNIRSHLAHWTGEAGDAIRTRDQVTALVADLIRVTGPDHPLTLADRAKLAYWTGEAGDAVGARDQYAALLPDQIRVFGADHRNTHTTRLNLQFWTRRALE